MQKDLNTKLGDLRFQVNCVAFSRDLEMMVTGSDDSLVRVFNATVNRLITSLSGHKGYIAKILFGS